jgi:hypothetical protein
MVSASSGFAPDLAANPVHGYTAVPATYAYEPSFQTNPRMLSNDPSWDFDPSAQSEDFEYMSGIPYTMA